MAICTKKIYYEEFCMHDTSQNVKTLEPNVGIRHIIYQSDSPSLDRRPGLLCIHVSIFYLLKLFIFSFGF